jgi:hypothetical protein
MMNAALLHGVDWECKKMNIFTGSLLEFGLHDGAAQWRGNIFMKI